MRGIAFGFVQLSHPKHLPLAGYGKYEERWRNVSSPTKPEQTCFTVINCLWIRGVFDLLTKLKAPVGTSTRGGDSTLYAPVTPPSPSPTLLHAISRRTIDRFMTFYFCHGWGRTYTALLS